MKKVIIIGCGASGLAVANTLNKNKDYEIVMLDQSNKVARKILASGNGRANISNLNMGIGFYNTKNCVIKEIVESFDYKEFFSSIKMETINNNELVYPYSNSSLTVKECLLEELKNISIIKEVEANSIDKKGNEYIVDTNKGQYCGDIIVICTGSKAGELSGTNNLSVLNSLNLKIKELTPSLVPLKTKEVYKELKGVRVKGEVSLIEDGTVLKSYEGEILFTDYGLSGICIMQLSRFIKENHNYQISLNLLNNINDDNYLENRYKKYGNYYYEGLFNKKLAKVINDNDLNPLNMVFTFKGLLDFSRAQVMHGGLDLSEIDNTLQIKKYPHIYACGEVLDVDGDCGGYNLHFAFASGQYVANAIIEGDKHVKDK